MAEYPLIATIAKTELIPNRASIGLSASSSVVRAAGSTVFTPGREEAMEEWEER